MRVRPGHASAHDSSRRPLARAEDHEHLEPQSCARLCCAGKGSASALGRLGRALEAALAELRAFDAQPPAADARTARRALVAQAGHALWLFVVQREALGLRDTRTLMRDYRVPAEVQHRMGVLPAKR